MILNVYLIKAKATIYAGDYKPPSRPRLARQSTPDLPLTAEQIEHLEIEPHDIRIPDKSRLKRVRTPDGQLREVVEDAEILFIMKIPNEYKMDEAMVFDLLNIVKDFGIGKFGKIQPLEVHYIGRNMEALDQG